MNGCIQGECLRASGQLWWSKAPLGRGMRVEIGGDSPPKHYEGGDRLRHPLAEQR
jgi:hypothetical protein